ncbi:ACT domain-containing protein [Maricaulis sp.]|uniref:ACT domain-containing protein n=1 Tax=Maricaulis sp. TaxID=1486257 RepID=UPI001B2B80B7|nr:ACT domain-containing protein [Maricaulis sp.]MBO6766505.1 ACT domain-containing protein [Maricaulis sp.]
MHGETDLESLLKGMSPRLHPGVWVFATLPPGTAEPSGLSPLMRYAEDEGTTLILDAGLAARANLETVFPCRRITLHIHSALEAVGFMAAIAQALAQAGIGCNPVAGYFHDHLFVPVDRAEEAMAVLERLSAGSDFD